MLSVFPRQTYFQWNAKKEGTYHHTGGSGVVLLVYVTFYTSYKYVKPLDLIYEQRGKSASPISRDDI